MKISIPNFITTRTYYSEDTLSSFSFIMNFKDRFSTALKDDFSELWKFIVDEPDYNKIKEFAYLNKLDSVLDEFLYQLKKFNLISTDLNFPENKIDFLRNTISFDSPNYTYYAQSQEKFCKKNRYIDNLEIILSYKCNLNCRHCCNPKNIDNYEIDFEQAKKIIDEAYNIGVYDVGLTGGECTLNKDFLNIAKYIRAKHLNLSFNTNGQKLYDDKNLLEEIINLYPCNIQLSLYSADPVEHDNMTLHKGSFDKTLYVIKKLKEHNIHVDIANFVCNYNKTNYTKLKNLAKELNVNYRSSCCFINNKDNNNFDVSLCEDDIADFYSKSIDFSKKYARFTKSNKPLCKAGIITLAVEPDLSVTPCNYNKHILGNLKNTTLTEIHKNVLPEYRKTFNSENLKECFQHDYCQYCGYCSMIASHDNGYLNKSEILCTQARAVQKAYQKYLNENKISEQIY